MIQYREALSLIVNLARQIRLESEIVALEIADSRVCSQDIFSPECVPSFDNSAMDGFAIQSADTVEASEANPIGLNVEAVVAAGDEVKSYSTRLKAIEIMTGAPLPNIFDAVVKIEDVEVHRSSNGVSSEIFLRSPVHQGNNLRKKGSDYQIGDLVLAKGAMIRAESMMALASLGISEVCVFRKPKVAILSTGKELVSPNTKTLIPGTIRNSTAIYLKTAISRSGGEIVSVDSLDDNADGFRAYIEKTIDQDVDVLVTTGAVSMGIYDFVPATLKALGAEIFFHKVAIRPGKPILMASISRQGRSPLTVFGIPGNPVSSAVGFRFFLTPFFRELFRQKPEQGLPVKLFQTTSKPEGLQCFFKARLESNENGIGVTALPGQASFMVSPLIQANSWVLFSEAGNMVNKNEEVLVYPLLPNESFRLGVL